MKLRSLYILSIVGLFLVVVIQLGGMMYAYDSYKKEAKRTLDECFRQAFIETVDNQVNNLPFPDYTVPFYSYIRRDEKMPETFVQCTLRLIFIAVISIYHASQLYYHNEKQSYNREDIE